jgi:hypothetical protein
MSLARPGGCDVNDPPKETKYFSRKKQAWREIEKKGREMGRWGDVRVTSGLGQRDSTWS